MNKSKNFLEKDLPNALNSLNLKFKLINYQLTFNPHNIYYASSPESFWERIIPKKLQKIMLSARKKQDVKIANFDFLDYPADIDYISKKLKPQQLSFPKSSQKLEELNKIEIAKGLKMRTEQQATTEIEMTTYTTNQKKLNQIKESHNKKLAKITEEIELQESKIDNPSR